ncbi:MAG: YdjY domain-containing protein [Planctomycetota bacterium]
MLAVPTAAAAGTTDLNEAGTVAIDRDAGELLLRGEVVLERGPLEMLVCRVGTKEHESIVAVDTPAVTVHAGLLALGLEPGSAVDFTDGFRPPAGPKLDIEMRWTAADGTAKTADAKSWVRRSIDRYFGQPLKTLPAGVVIPKGSELRHDPRYGELSWYGPMTDAERDGLLALSDDVAFRAAITRFYEQTREVPLDAAWVFAGSRFFHDPATGRRLYGAEGGELVCVANFPAATIDIAERSTAENAGRVYEAWTGRVPPRGTAVTVVLKAAEK